MYLYGGIDQYTKLLLHGDGTDASTFVPDISGNYIDGGKCVCMLHFDGADAAVATKEAATNKTVTFVGTAQLDTAQSKFGGSSLLLDGNSDYVSLATNSDWQMGSGDFTMELWFRTTVSSDLQGIFCLNDTSDTKKGFMCYLNDDTEHLMFLRHSTDGANWTDKSFAWNPVPNTWYHLAFVRNGNELKFYVDGTQTGNTADLTGVTYYASTATLLVGAAIHSSALTMYTNGWIDDFRIIKGKALYTANFTAPTVSPSPKDVTCVGNAQIDTAQKVFGTGSILFDGTGDYLSLADSDDFNFGSDSFTLDFWIKRTRSGTREFISGMYSATSSSFEIQFDTANTFTLYIYKPQQVAATSTGTISDTNWHHLVAERDGNTLRLFIDGVADGTADVTGYTLGEPDSYLAIGRNGTYDGLYFAGWIDEFRISKGVARWTKNFVPPALPYGLNTPRIITVS